MSNQMPPEEPAAARVDATDDPAPVVADDGVRPPATENETPTEAAPASEERPTGTDDAEDPSKRAPTNPHKKRKVALTFAYVGAGYAGMQRNPGVQTIEGELEAAITRAGGISDANAGDFSKVQWTRAARTDKGVSAVGQVIALKMVLEPPGMLERINEALPDNFEVFGIDRVTNGFNAKTMCDKRRYEYVIPTWAFNPNSSPEDGFEFTEEIRQKVNRVLGNYCGTHNFHNFTVKVRPTDPQAKRYIISFDCSEPFEVDGERFVRCVVLGQSFMLHQIRKLIGTMLAVVRGEISENDQKFALLTHQFAPTPMAPELGLFLCECVYGAYNNRFGSVHEKFELAKHGDKSEAFKRKHVYTHIARQEREENTMRNWIRDVLHGERSLRNQFDAGMAASIAAEEQLDPTRVGQRPKKRPAPDSDAGRAVRDSFNTAMSEAAERAKAKKLKSSFNDRNLERADGGQADPQKRVTEKPKVEVKSHIPSDELSE